MEPIVIRRRPSGAVVATAIASASLVVSFITSAMVLSRAYVKGRELREIAGYTLSRTLEVTSRDPSRVAKAACEVTELLKHGVQVSSRSPAYHCTHLSDVKVQMVGDATANARERAELIAQKSG